MKKIKRSHCLVIGSLLLSSIIIFSGCKGAPGDGTLTETPSSVTSEVNQISPLQSPVMPISPVFTPETVPQKTVNLVHSTVSQPDHEVKQNIDLTMVALHSDDMDDLFDITYSIAQPYQKTGMRGLDVTYPSRVIEHTSAFAEGYRTKIEIYDHFQKAVDAYDLLVAEQVGEVIDTNFVGELSNIFSKIETDGVYTHAYEIIVLKSNALVDITIKIERELPTDVLRQKTLLVLDRLELE